MPEKEVQEDDEPVREQIEPKLGPEDTILAYVIETGKGDWKIYRVVPVVKLTKLESDGLWSHLRSIFGGFRVRDR
jgi:hypothetical protein